MNQPESDSGILSMFDVDNFFSYYYGDSSQHNAEVCREQYTWTDHYGTTYNNNNNEEVTAHALQEQFSGLSITGASESLHTGEYLQLSTDVQPWPHVEYQQSSSGVQPWQSPSKNYCAGNNDALEEIDNVGASNSCSDPGTRYYGGEEQNHALEITEEPEIDGEVAKRLNDMNAVPHIPRINGDIPPIEVAMSDHERLLSRLQVSGLVENKVEGDGNCQFRALSDQFYQTPEHHYFVRQQVVKQLKDHPEMYEGYVPMAYSEYLKMMVKNGEWGDHVTLQAAADLYGMKILVITSFKDTCYIEIVPKIPKSTRVIYLSFWAEVHYNSIYPQGGNHQLENYELCAGDWSAGDLKVKKKKWWNFRNKNQNQNQR